jgi:hypothetical protein
MVIIKSSAEIYIGTMYHTGTPEWIFNRAAHQKIAQMKFGFIQKKPIMN